MKKTNVEAEERLKRLSSMVIDAWKEREEIISDPKRYLCELPDCKSGTSFSGPLFLPIGALLESWINCPEFRLPDGRFILRFSSGLSGYTSGEAINMRSGRISLFESASSAPNSRTALIRSSEPFRRKAEEYKRNEAPQCVTNK